MAMPREQHVTEAFVEVADSLTGEFDVIELLHRLSVHCVGLLNVSAAGVLLADQHDELQLIAASDENTRLLELFALQHSQGPCVECYTTGQQRTDIDLTSPTVTEAWPLFAASARDTGFKVTHAIPLRLHRRVIGALNLFQTRTGSISEEDVILAQAIADIATITIVRQRTLDQSQLERVQLQQALNSRIVVEQVKGLLAERWQCPVDEAFTALRSYARSQHLLLADLGRQIIAGQIATDQIPR
ncbi:GAF and ANTAR domain-containing protein (plasmid) [Kitasatospora sp. NBC_00070]|uniref:GAF and ANTAR domain-containing protein n=1 Tax=Kitasatospora sp. NBC_00070 TaxID=2975962 RepID=UPI002F909728